GEDSLAARYKSSEDAGCVHSRRLLARLRTRRDAGLQRARECETGGRGSPLEGNVVVRAGSEVCVLGLRGCTRGDELRLAALGVGAATEELDAVGDDLDRLALRSVLCRLFTP